LKKEIFITVHPIFGLVQKSTLFSYRLEKHIFFLADNFYIPLIWLRLDSNGSKTYL